MSWCQIIHKVSTNPPSQRQLPATDSVVGIVVSRGAKFDVLIPTTVRKDLLHPFVERLGKRFQVFVVVEFGISQLL